MLPVIPLLNKIKLDIPRGSWVRVDTKGDGVLEGQIYENPIVTSRNQNLFSIQIIHVTNLTNGQNVSGMLTLYENEIATVVLKGKGDLTEMQAAKDIKKTNFMEYCVDTIVISTMYQLHNLFKYMVDDGVNEVGCSFECLNESEQVHWVVLTVSKTIVPIHVAEISKKVDNLWETLGNHLFSNNEITKIFFDCDVATKYLYKVHGIHLKNVFDIRIADIYTHAMSEKKDNNVLQPSDLEESARENKNDNLKLAEFLLKYLGNMTHPREIELLKTYDNEKSRNQHSENLLDVVLSNEKLEDSSNPKNELKLYKVMAIKAKFLSFLKTELEKRMLGPLEKLINGQMTFIMSADNATSHAFLTYS